jgi:phosphoglycolate phosphatase
MRTALFDLDGTLADTGADLIAAANSVFDEPLLDPIEDKATAFRGGRAMLRLALKRLGNEWSEEDVDRLFQPFLDYYGMNIQKETELYDGVWDVLNTLSDQGWVLGICTNKPFVLADRLVNGLGIRHHFRALIGADSLDVRKPDPKPVLETILRAGGSPAQAALIGDTVTDHKAARAARIRSVLVTFGPEGDKVAMLEPDALLDDYAALPGILKRLIP